MTTNGLSSSQLPPGMGISKYVVRKDRHWVWTSQNLNAVQWVQDDFHTLFTAHFWLLCTGISGYTRLTWWWCMSMLMLIANRVNIIPITIVIRWNWQLCHYKLLFWPSFSTIFSTPGTCSINNFSWINNLLSWCDLLKKLLWLFLTSHVIFDNIGLKYHVCQTLNFYTWCICDSVSWIHLSISRPISCLKCFSFVFIDAIRQICVFSFKLL